MSILDWNLYVEMNDGSIWSVPVAIIARHRAEYYGDQFPSFEESFENALELFSCDFYEIKDWAQDNMDWEEVKKYAIKIEDSKIDYQEGWKHGYKEIGP